MAELSKLVKERMAAQPPTGQHPDADLLSAFAEQRVAPGERQTMLAHFAKCERCREVLALSLPEQPEAPAVSRSESTRSRFWLWAPLTAVVALTAAVLVLTPKMSQRSELAMAPQAQVQSTVAAPSAASKLNAEQSPASSAQAEPKGKIAAKAAGRTSAEQTEPKSTMGGNAPEKFDTEARAAAPAAPVIAAAQQQASKDELSQSANAPVAESVSVTAESATVQMQSSQGAAADLNMAKAAPMRKMVLTPGTPQWRVREGVLEHRKQGDAWEKVDGPWSAKKQAVRTLDVAAQGELTVTDAAGERWASADGGETWSEAKAR